MELIEDAPPHEVALWEVLAHAAGALSSGRAAEVAAHLETCAFCRERLAGIPELDYWLALEADPPAPAPGERRLLAALDRWARRRRRRGRLRTLARAALGARLPRLPRHALYPRGATGRALCGGLVGALTLLALLAVPRRRPRRS